MTTHCRTYWGTHGCQYDRGHDPIALPHKCECCTCGEAHPDPERAPECVGAPPYYGVATRFYGADVPEASE